MNTQESLSSPKRKPFEPSPIAGASEQEIDAAIGNLGKNEAEEIELTEADLEEIPQESNGNGVIRRAEMRVIESPKGDALLRTGVASETSPEHPDRNEDAFFVTEKGGVACVADGMGGVPAGDFAGSRAIEQFARRELEKMDAVTRKVFESDRDVVLKQTEVEHALDTILRRMDERVAALGKEDPRVVERAVKFFEEKMKMPYDKDDERHRAVLEELLQAIGCTASISKIWRGPDEKDRITVGNVGDSAIYILRNGELEKLTKDDSCAQVLINAGVIENDQDITQKIDKRVIIELADAHPELRSMVPALTKQSESFVTVGSFRRRVTQAIGVSKMMKKEFGTVFTPRVETFDLEDGDVILTATDGLTDNLTDKKIAEILLKHKNNPLEAAQALKQEALEVSLRGKEKDVRAKKDDITVLVTSYTRT